MKIISLKLVGYHRLSLRQIEHFEYKPTKKTQVILGTNGSGKSSILHELSPLPAVASDYSKTGRKEIVLTHNGHHYNLQSLFDPSGAKYIFEVDGENLNPGHTQTVYRELCKVHFNYTPEVHSLLTGKVKFRSMSVAERRNWFMKISETDYTYAIKYHNSLKDKIRETQVAIKLNQARLTQEAEKCLSEKDEEETRQKVIESTRILNTLLEHRKPRLSDSKNYYDRVNSIEVALKSDLDRLEKLLSDTDENVPVNSIEALQELSVSFQATIQSVQNEVVERCEKIDKLQKDLDAVTQSSKSSLEEVQLQLKDLSEEESNLVNQIKLHLHYENAQAALSSFEACRPELDNILELLLELPRLNYTKEDYERYVSQTPQKKDAVLRAEKFESECFLKRRMLEENKAKGSLECPECHHTWYQNYNEAQYQIVLKNHNGSIELHNTAKKQLENHLLLIQEYEFFSSLLGRFRRLTSSFENLESLWSYIKKDNRLLEDPSLLRSQLNNIAIDLQVLVKIEKIKKQITELEKLEKLMQSTKLLDKTKIEKDITTETDLLNKAQNRLRYTHISLEQTKNKIKTINLIYEYQSKVADALSVREMILRSLVEDSCIETLDELIYSVRLQVSQYERMISQVDLQRSLVKSLKNEIETNEKELRLLKMAQKAVSPTEGLIAKGMTGFINHFVKQINKFISEIWLYPLELIPIEVSDDELLDLDYKFSVRVNNDTRTIPDISLCSAGMQEVINLAFVAVSMKYLGLSNFPIFLDEFAVTLDQAHRNSAYKAIDHIIDSAEYSQVYVVSHYQDGYSALTSSEILVLCDNNIQMPDHLVFNKHVILK